MSVDLLKSSMHTTTCSHADVSRNVWNNLKFDVWNVDCRLLVIELIRSDPMVYGRLNLRSDQGELIDRLMLIRECPFLHPRPRPVIQVQQQSQEALVYDFGSVKDLSFLGRAL